MKSEQLRPPPRNTHLSFKARDPRVSRSGEEQLIPRRQGPPPAPQGFPSKVIKASQIHHSPSGPHCPRTKGRLSRARAPEVPHKKLHHHDNPSRAQAGAPRHQDEWGPPPSSPQTQPEKRQKEPQGKADFGRRGGGAVPGCGVWARYCSPFAPR